MKEMLSSLSRADVQRTMTRVEAGQSRSDAIANELSQHLFDQPQAVKAIAKRVALHEAGLAEPTRPIASIYELGPTGVGKTEAAHALSRFWFDDPHSPRLKIINMSEFQEPHTTAKFVGAPQGYVGGTEQGAIPHAWLHSGRSIIVFDEFEKANPTIQRLVLGILDKGTMNARNGQKGFEDLHFENSFIFFTSNVAASEISQITEGKQRNIGFINQDEGNKAEAIARVAQKEMRKVFAPEFVSRLDEVVVFNPLERESFGKIYDKVIERRNAILFESLKGEAPFFATTNEFKDFVLDQVVQNGGREVRRILDSELFDKAADLFSGMDVARRPFVADREENETVFYTTDPEPDPEPVIDENLDAPINIDDFRDRDNLPAPYDDASEETKKKAGDDAPARTEPDSSTPPPNKPRQKLGVEVRIWDESMVEDDGTVQYVAFMSRDIPLPRK